MSHHFEFCSEEGTPEREWVINVFNQRRLRTFSHGFSRALPTFLSVIIILYTRRYALGDFWLCCSY